MFQHQNEWFPESLSDRGFVEGKDFEWFPLPLFPDYFVARPLDSSKEVPVIVNGQEGYSFEAFEEDPSGEGDPRIVRATFYFFPANGERPAILFLKDQDFDSLGLKIISTEQSPKEVFPLDLVQPTIAYYDGSGGRYHFIP